MKNLTAAVALLLSFLALCPYVLSAKVVHIPISRSNPDLNVLSRDLKGNGLTQGTVTSDLSDSLIGGSGYLVNVMVGTPGQALSLMIDTGSSDTFVLAKNDDQCNNLNIMLNYGPCIGGTFDPSESSTFTIVAAGGFNIEYVDRTGSSGDYISDNFEIGGALVVALQMGLALHSTVGVGIMGIGYRADESVSPNNRYPNLVDQLVAQRFINVRAYSLYLDDREASSGSILFGGIDTEKFIGSLKVLPVQKNPITDTINAFFVQMTSLSITDISGKLAWTSSSISIPVVLDSGTTLIYLPLNLVNIIISLFGAIDDTDNSGFIFVDCDWSITRANDSLGFGFGGSNEPVIYVPLSELIRAIPGQYPQSPFNSTCDLGVRAAINNTYLLGDTFLRSAYVVYDIDNNQIALAQTNFEAPGSEVHEIPSGATGIPLLSGQATGLTQVPQGSPTNMATAEATPSIMFGSVSIPGGGGTAMPSTQTTTPTSKSAAMKLVSMSRKDGLDVLSVSILLALTGGFYFLVL